MRKRPVVLNEPLNMRLPREMLRAIEAHARAEKTTVSAWVRAHLEKTLRRMSNSVAP
jgi:predicted HicB family RNase H-like nuclease